MNKSNITLLHIVLFILSIAFATVNGWCECTSRNMNSFYQLHWTTCNMDYCSKSTDALYYRCGSDCDPCSLMSLTSNQSCTFNPDYACSDGNTVGCPDGSTGLSGSTRDYRLIIYTCDSQCEADSITCISGGNIWTDAGASTCGGKTCKINHCKAADSTWLSTSIAACTGSNNYSLVNTDSTCEHVGTCCPNDSIPSGNTCKWRCDSILTTCNGRTGSLFGAVLPDTSVSGEDTTFSYQCFYNCAYSPNPDSTVYLVEGNTVLSGPNDSIADGIKSEWFSSIRSTTGSIYVYDYLSPSASEYVDSIAAMKCVEHLWRCVINNKYVYWYDNQEVPAGCTNIVRVK